MTHIILYKDKDYTNAERVKRNKMDKKIFYHFAIFAPNFFIR